MSWYFVHQGRCRISHFHQYPKDSKTTELKSFDTFRAAAWVFRRRWSSLSRSFWIAWPDFANFASWWEAASRTFGFLVWTTLSVRTFRRYKTDFQSLEYCWSIFNVPWYISSAKSRTWLPIDFEFITKTIPRRLFYKCYSRILKKSMLPCISQAHSI